MDIPDFLTAVSAPPALPDQRVFTKKFPWAALCPLGVLLAGAVVSVADCGPMRSVIATAVCLVRVGAFTSSLRPLTSRTFTSSLRPLKSRTSATFPRLMCSSAGAAQEAVTASEPDKTILIHAGSASLPPLVQVPGGFLPLMAVVKPPDADVLWQWELSRGNMEADTSWASVWPAAANLAALIARSPELVRGLRVCELGSGLGVAGLSAAKAGATTVTLVDREALALHCAMSTAEVCGCA